MEPITASSPAASPTSQLLPPKKAEEQKNQFLQLLVAQIKGQNPLNPMEGSEFVSQLAQFSSLEELTHMSSTMDSVRQLLSAQAQNQSNQSQELI